MDILPMIIDAVISVVVGYWLGKVLNQPKPEPKGVPHGLDGVTKTRYERVKEGAHITLEFEENKILFNSLFEKIQIRFHAISKSIERLPDSDEKKEFEYIRTEIKYELARNTRLAPVVDKIKAVEYTNDLLDALVRDIQEFMKEGFINEQEK